MHKKKFISFNGPVVKDINERTVLKLIQESETISSSDLVGITGMRPSTVFNILKELSVKSFVLMNGKGESTSKGGKKPYTWTLNKNAAYVIGLDIEVDEMTWVLVDFSGKIVSKRIMKFTTGRTGDELAKNILQVINQVITDNKIDKKKIIGLGIAFSGIVDHQKGVVVMSSVISEMNFPLLQKINGFPFPVIVENNANAAAIGLKWNRNTNIKTKNNFLTALVEIDKNVSGLGIGIVIDGELYRGVSYCAGELYPHMPTLREFLSTVRSNFSESDILKNYTSSMEEIDIEFLLDAAKQGDELARQIFYMIGSIVGQTIAQAVALLNPDTLIITGIVSELEDVVVSAVRKEIDMRVLSITSNSLNIIADRNHHYAVAFGAAALILEDFFRIPLSRISERT